MKIRPYVECMDYEVLKKWIDDERTHALWCAKLTPYPMDKVHFHTILEENAKIWLDSAFVVIDDNGRQIGFFCYSINLSNNSGFIKFFIVDNKQRGNGLGSKILYLALKYAFEITNVDFVQLNVFEENIGACKCYKKVGFHKDKYYEKCFEYENEVWSKYHMIIQKQDLIV